MNRRDWYFRQRVTEAEMGDADDQIEAAMWEIVKEIIGFGFLQGGAVTQHAPTPDLSTDVQWFLGYDQLGRRLYLPVALAPEVVNCAVDEVGAPTAVVGALNEKTLALFIEFDRKLSDPRLDGNGSTVFWKSDEWFKVNVVQSAEAPLGTSVPPPLRNDQILIADVLLVFGQTQILNADISQTRKEDFTFSGFTHGASHREFGTDPVPNATPSDGGIMSSSDKTKLDGISWTGPGAAALLGLIGRPIQPANVVAPSATTLDVSTEMSGKTPGGSPSVKGVVTDPPDNRVILRDDNFDDFLDGSGNKVYGRLTEAAGTWTLSFYSYPAGGPETAFDMTPYSGQTILWFVQETYSLDSFPTFDPSFSVPSDQLAGEVPDGTETIKGKVQFEPHGGTTALRAVQASDPRLSGAGALALIRKLASRPALVWTPHDDLSPAPTNTAYNTQRLHQFHGLAQGDYQTGAVNGVDYFFEYDRLAADYPIDCYFTGSPNGTPGIKSGAGGGNADNSLPVQSTNTWYYCYLIGRDKANPKHYAVVYSDRPPSVGPLLDDSSFAFWNGGVAQGGPNYEGGWRYWRFIGCLVNGVTPGSWELVQLRKYGNHVEFELAQLTYSHGIFGDSGWIKGSLAGRVPPTSIRAFLMGYVEGRNATQTLELRPPGIPPAHLVNMDLHEIPGAGFSRNWKIATSAFPITAGLLYWNRCFGWVDLNVDREVGFHHIGGGTDHNAYINVLGYEEFTDKENGNHIWPT